MDENKAQRSRGERVTAWLDNQSAQARRLKEQKDAAALAKGPGSKINAKFSAASSDGTCPKCGSVAFKAKRSMGGKVAGGLLAPKTRVKCVTCGTEYRRG